MRRLSWSHATGAASCTKSGAPIWRQVPKMTQQPHPRIAIVGPGAKRWGDGPFARGAQRIAVDDAHAADFVCLVDESTSPNEVETLWRFRCDGVVLVSRGAWSVAPGRLHDSFELPHEPRSTVDVALPGPLLAPMGEVSGLLAALSGFRPVDWNACSRRWAGQGVPVVSLRLRSGQPAIDDLQGATTPRSRVRIGWHAANLVALPDAERRGAVVRVPASGVAVVGAQRSGTTMMSHLLGRTDRLVTVPEKRCLRTLIDEHQLGRPRVGRLVWHATFLTPCEQLLSAVCDQLPVIAMIRSPEEVVRSMLYNWQGLDDVSQLVTRTGSGASWSRLDTAISIVRRSWQNLLRETETRQDVVIVDYAKCLLEPGCCVEAACARLALDASVGPELANVVSRSTAPGQLQDRQTRRVMARCAGLYERLRTRAI